MARWATLCEIAGVSFTGCRAEVVDGEEFHSPRAGSVDRGNDGTPHIQVVDRGVKGIQFGIVLMTAEATKITSVLSAYQITEGLGSTFPVKINDGIYNINVNVFRDYTNPKFPELGRHSEGWYENVLWRFVVESQGV